MRRTFWRRSSPPKRDPTRYRLVVAAGDPAQHFPLESYPYPDAVSAYEARGDYLAYQQRNGWHVVGECNGEVLIAKPYVAPGVHVLLTLLVAIVPVGFAEPMALPTVTYSLC